MTRKALLFGLFFSILLTTAFFWSFLLHLNQPIGYSHADTYLADFIFQHYIEITSSHVIGNIFNLRMFYPYRSTLLYTEPFFLQGLTIVICNYVFHDLILSSNFIRIIIICSSCFSMYMFIFTLSKSKLLAVFGAIIFVFNPYVVTRFPDHINLYTLMWIPLSFYFFEKMLEIPQKKIYQFLLFLTFIAQILSSLHYAVFLPIFFIPYACIRIWQIRPDMKNFINAASISGFLIFIFIAGSISFAYIQIYNNISIGRPLALSDLYANWPIDIVLSAPEDSLLYGNVKTTAENTIPYMVKYVTFSENSAFLGITPFILLVASFIFLLKKDFRKKVLIYEVFFIFALFFSFGPTIHITDTLALKGPYVFLYTFYPLLSFVRAPERFSAFSFFFLSIIVSFTLNELLSFLQPKKLWTVAVLILILLVLLEYAIKPTVFLKDLTKQKQLYTALNTYKNIHVILELPIGNNITPGLPNSRNIQLDEHYLLWAALFHKKTLLNGYAGYMPERYYQMALALTFNFPTPEKLHVVKKRGVDAIILHRYEFGSLEQYVGIRERLKLLGIREVFENKEGSIFMLSK